MGSRRKSRELALQALFHMDLQKRFEPEMVERFCGEFPPSDQTRSFFARLVNGIMAERASIDELIERFSSNWKISRMGGVDRNLLRIAVFELLYCDDIPSKVSINEAIDLAKKFGSEESGAFINGILDSIRLAIDGGEVQPVVGAGGADAFETN